MILLFMARFNMMPCYIRMNLRSIRIRLQFGSPEVIYHDEIDERSK